MFQYTGALCILSLWINGKPLDLADYLQEKIGEGKKSCVCPEYCIFFLIKTAA